MRTRWCSAVLALLGSASIAGATPIDDFRRAGSLELLRASSTLDTPFGARELSSAGGQCLTKPPGSLDFSWPLDGFGIPGVAVPFTGAQVDDSTLRLTTNSLINRCVTLDGSEMFLERVEGALTVGFRPRPAIGAPAGMCGSGFTQDLTVMGGGSSDVNNRLVFHGRAGCGVAFGGSVTAHSIILEGLGGAAPPPPPMVVPEVASLDAMPRRICPVPDREHTVTATVRLSSRVMGSAATFSAQVSDPSIVIPSTFTVPVGAEVGRFTATVPASYAGSFTLTARRAGSATSRSVTVWSDNGLGGVCDLQVLIPRPVPRRWFEDCWACQFFGRLTEVVRPAVRYPVKLYGKAEVFQSRPALSGYVVGWVGSAGNYTGTIAAPGKVVLELPDVRLYALNDSHLAVGTWEDPKTGVTQAYLTDLYTSQTLKGLGGVSSEALAINAAGQVAGWAEDSKGFQQAVVWDANGSPTQLMVPGALSAQAQLITDSGWVGGTAIDVKGNRFVFLEDLTTGKTQQHGAPAGFTSVELVDVNAFGRAAVRLTVWSGATVPGLLDQAGVRPLSALLSPKAVADEVFGIDDNDGLFVRGSVEGVPQEFIAEPQ